MKSSAASLVVSVFIAGTAQGWQAWDDREVFSTPDGTVQFIELYSPTNGQGLLGSRELRSVSGDGTLTNVFTFDHDVSNQSSNKTVLLATPGFATLPGGVLADYTIPTGFLFVAGGSFWIVGGAATQTWSAGQIPADGANSLATPGLATHRASPRNNSGQEGAVLVAVPGGGRVYYQGLYHNRPNRDPTVETLPAPFSSHPFLDVAYASTSVIFRFLTASPAGDGEVEGRVRIYPLGPGGNSEQFVDAVNVTSLELTVDNPFHGLPVAESLIPSNTLRNPGFETNGIWWIPFGQAGFTSNTSHSGTFSGFLGDSNGYHGLYQTFPARSNRVFSFHAWARKDAGYTASNTWLKLEWKNAQTSDIGYVDYDIHSLLSTNWQFFSMLATSPANTALVRPVLLALGAGSGSNRVYWDDAVFTNLPPSDGTNLVDLWEAAWFPPRTFTGTVYYAPHVVTRSNGVIRDTIYLLRTLGPNAGSTNFGINDFYWPSEAQSFGRDYFELDYSFPWTNPAPYNFDDIYFNHPAAGLPESEAVPGLGGITFFAYNAGADGLSYVHTLAPPGGISSLQTRFDFVNGGGEIWRAGYVFTSVVVEASNSFHGVPASGAVTLDVWRTEFYPPPNWSGQPVYYATQITTPYDGTTWLVADLANSTNGIPVTNNLVSPQYFYTGGPVNRDWSYTPGAPISRQGVQRDYLYHNHTSLNAQAEAVPGFPGLAFLEVNYAATTTTFFVMTDHPANRIPGEDVTIQMRIDYNHPETGYNPLFHNLTWQSNVVIDTAPGFHGLPAGGTHTVEIWRLDWPQPRTGLGQPVTNLLTIYYAPLIKTTLGPLQYQTDYLYLLANAAGGTANSFPIQPQIVGSDFNGYDYSYPHLFTSEDSDGDGMPDAWEMLSFLTLTNSWNGDWDGDGLNNGGEYVADTHPTNGASLFGEVSGIGAPGTVMAIQVEPTSAARWYGVQMATNLLDGPQVWSPAAVGQAGNGGTLLLTVTNLAGSASYRAGVWVP